jgi:uncharacterized protein (DUF1697 family)
MPVYIVLFRGVGGATQLPVAPLREALAAAGFENVATYINSGNAVVKSHLPATKIVSTIAGICSSAFGFEKAIYALTLAEWDRIIANCPFQPAEGKFLHAAWLERDPDPGKIEALSELCTYGDQFSVVDKVAYIHTPRGFSKSKLAERFDKWIGVPNTARNWNTVLKLRELAVRAQ